PGRARLAVGDRRGRAVQHEAGGGELGGEVGDAEAQRLEIGEARAELPALAQVFDGAIEAELGAAERAGGDAEAAAVEPGHGDREALPVGADAVPRRHPAIREIDRGGRLRLPAELLLRRAEREPRRFLLDHQARYAFRAAA